MDNQTIIQLNTELRVRFRLFILLELELKAPVSDY